MEIGGQMNRSNKAVFIILVIIIGLLAASTGILLAMNLSNSSSKTPVTAKKTTDSTDTTKDKTTTTTAEKPADTTTTTNTPTTTTSAVTEAAPLGDRPSSPTDSHKVVAGETLFQIAKLYDLTWIQIADANGLSEADANKIKVGQTLIIPKNNQIGYTINQIKVQSLQGEVDAGKKIFRLSALDTAKSDISPCYGIIVSDAFKETKVDNTSGTATITVTRNSKIYEIKLTQPATKGEKGIWAIESVKPVTA